MPAAWPRSTQSTRSPDSPCARHWWFDVAVPGTKEVAALDGRHQDTWLDRAERRAWTRADLRAALREAKLASIMSPM